MRDSMDEPDEKKANEVTGVNTISPFCFLTFSDFVRAIVFVKTNVWVSQIILGNLPWQSHTKSSLTVIGEIPSILQGTRNLHPQKFEDMCGCSMVEHEIALGLFRGGLNDWQRKCFGMGGDTIPA